MSYKTPKVPYDLPLKEFRLFLDVDRGLCEETIKGYVRDVNSFIEKYGIVFEKSIVRQHLVQLTSNRRRKVLAALKQLYRFVGRLDVVAGFKMPRSKSRIVRIPSKEELRCFYDALPNVKHRAFFLMLASSGLRISELLSVTNQHIEFEKRMLTPHCHEGATKHSYITFYNYEADHVLKQYLAEHSINGGRIFSQAKRTFQNTWRQVAKKLDIKISAQVLREWFCSEMGRLGIPDRYIDAFCGRVPKSILARHYTDYSPERLKEIYDNAGLKVLQ